MPHSPQLVLPSIPLKEQSHNRALWNDARSLSSADFFTLGYTGRKLDELIPIMLKAGVQSLVDIRSNPVSMYRPELSKNNLKRSVEEHGLSYVHFPNLGVPRDIRVKAITSGTREAIWQWYDTYVVEPFIGKNLHRFLNCVDHPAALMCVEIDPRECHRHRLFLALETHGLRGFDL
jgi:uncharacterized protein (DUF488 family)